MNSQIIILSITAATIGFFHTLFGPDHYLPFVVLSKARKWSKLKTIWITILCGIGHVGSSILVGTIGIAAGIALSKLEYFESVRANIAGWLFIIFGLLYTIWGIKKAFNKKSHTHIHTQEKIGYKNLTPWILFVIFVLGPCEPLIPLLMFPAFEHNIMGLFIVTMVFGIVTITTMTGIVILLSTGFEFIKFDKIEKYTHALAGVAIFLSGIAIQFMGL